MLGPGEETKAMHDEDRKDPLPIGWFALFTPSDAMPKDRGLYVKRRMILMAIGLVVLGACWGLAQSDEFVEKVYVEGFGQSVGRGLAAVSGVLPTSMAEVMVVLVLGWFVFLWARASWYVARRKRRVLNALACGGLHLGAFAAVALSLFYVFWGLNYARAPLIERQGWQAQAAPPESREAQVEELEALSRQMVIATNQRYVGALGTDDYGVPSAARAEMSYINASIDRGYTEIQNRLNLHKSFAASRGTAKPVALSELMNYLQIGGFYFPWTGEANYNHLLPGCTLPFIIAHEKAHQRCITSEDEANFFAYLACIHSDDAFVQYSGYLFAQRQLLSELIKLDRERALEILAMRLPGVQRDVDAIWAYWARYEEGVAKQVGEASRAVNDAYLKANKVEGGVQSYRMSAKLLIVYSRKEGSSGRSPAGE